MKRHITYMIWKLNSLIPQIGDITMTTFNTEFEWNIDSNKKEIKYSLFNETESKKVFDFKNFVDFEAWYPFNEGSEPRTVTLHFEEGAIVFDHAFFSITSFDGMSSHTVKLSKDVESFYEHSRVLKALGAI